ncbi:TPA: hypothetical protein EYO57_27925 [Candidatus Poribacteria bacterium]|nr:hypothetical protein [Candidatus Poribacteria bacterium]
MFLKQTIKLVFFIFVLGHAMSSKAQTLIVQKIEPPNWWIGMKWNRIQLMLYGQNLGGISVQFSDKNLKVTAVHTNPSSSYAFVEVEIPDDLSAGRYTVEITQGNKYSILDYPILEREKSSQRNQGFSVDDVIYLITPDRFANGNTTNDQVEGILDDFDF